MKKTDRIFVINHDKMPGRAFVRRLKEKGFENLLLADRKRLDLLDRNAVSMFFKDEKPDYVILTSARSGGVMANMKYPADFLYENLQTQNNVINSAKERSAKKLIFLGASCVYPKDCPQPMREEYLLTGPLEESSESFSLAKIAGIKMCQAFNKQYKANFIPVIPATIYGPGDDYDIEMSHVIPALIAKFHAAKSRNMDSVVVWGSGNVRRDFIYADDLADLCLFLMDNPGAPGLINVGPGSDISIRDLAYLIRDIVGFNGNIKFDASKPEGASHKSLDITKLRSLCQVKFTELATGIRNSYEHYIMSLTPAH